MNDKSRPPSAVRVVKGVKGGYNPQRCVQPDSSGGGSAKPDRQPLTTEDYARGVLNRDSAVLGRAVTLIESNAANHQRQAQELLQRIQPHTGKSIRVAVSGPPGAGKSVLIEALGGFLTARGRHVAVMAVDPSSSLTRGSILADKTRMARLSQDPRAFIRPVPTGGTLGGVARKTRETMLLFEAAGYDVILLETVGAGQSEIAARSMVDFFLLVLVAGAGDELQGLKKGVMEIADAVVINKADGDNVPAAQLARSECESALHYLARGEGWHPPVLTASALEGRGVGEIWSQVERFQRESQAGGSWDQRRREQAREWLREMLDQRIRERFYRHRRVKDLLPTLEQQIQTGSCTVTQAVWEILRLWEENPSEVDEN